MVPEQGRGGAIQNAWMGMAVRGLTTSISYSYKERIEEKIFRKVTSSGKKK